ncbi:MAG: hypothetical protein J7515_10230 [Caulobacter sp.]|nr:hypothetical protein [Caulobacter sp.]
MNANTSACSILGMLLSSVGVWAISARPTFSRQVREPVLLASKRIEDREVVGAEFDGVPVDRPVLPPHIVQRAPEEFFDVIRLPVLGLDADEQCAIDHLSTC